MVIGEQTIITSGKPKDILKSEKARELYFGSYENYQEWQLKGTLL